MTCEIPFLILKTTLFFFVFVFCGFFCHLAPKFRLYKYLTKFKPNPLNYPFTFPPLLTAGSILPCLPVWPTGSAKPSVKQWSPMALLKHREESGSAGRASRGDVPEMPSPFFLSLQNSCPFADFISVELSVLLNKSLTLL